MICIILIEILFFITQVKPSHKEVENNAILSSIETISHNTTIENTSKVNEPTNKNILSNSSKEMTTKIIEKVLPSEIEGFEIIGKIEIPKLNINNYILKENSSKALDVSVVKLFGPEINNIGNFCIAGHNYKKMFKEIINLEKNDKILLTDVYGNCITYQVYDIYQTIPKDVSCLEQNTNGEREITLITCTTGAIKRLIVKAVEVYD